MLTTLPLDRLQPHPRNSNVMPGELLAKLTAHIGRTGRYPPLIVRPLPDGVDTGEPRYQLLDGHHRAQALRELGRTEARCDVWEVDDDEALVLLASLNRLEGADDPRKRAALLGELSRRIDPEALAQRLPEDRPRIKAMVDRAAPPPKPRTPRPDGLPVAVTFFLTPTQRDRLDARLAALADDRVIALMRLVDREGQESCDSPRRRERVHLAP